MSKIILASKSLTRAALLKDAGLDVVISNSGVDEKNIKQKNKQLSGSNLADLLAATKAKTVASSAGPEDYIIGADQVLLFKGEVWDKPKTTIEAKIQLKNLRGKTHQLYSSVSVYKNNIQVFKKGDIAALSMRNFSDGFLDDYLSKMGDDVLTTVGGYKLEGIGAQLFERIEGNYFTILGLPVMPLLAFFRSQKILKD